jgi:hypothetical protein
MSDYDEFKKVINGFEKSIEYECSDPDLINSIFRDIRDMVETMIQKRDKELEGRSSPKVSQGHVEKPPTDKPEKECPPGKIVNPKTGRCINKPKEKTHKKPGRPKKFDKPEESEEPKEKPKKECSPGKILNPKTGRCINKPKEKTQKRRGRPKKSVMPAEKSKSPPVSKYHQKQYEKFLKTTDKDDLKEAFFEKKPEEPEKVPRYNLRGMRINK